MILSKGPKYFLGLTVLAAAGGLFAADDLAKMAVSLIEAEKAYAGMGSEKGFRAASLSVFADEAVIFAPGPVNGKRFWEKETEEPFLIWQPIFASIARSGELGYTTGPWESRKARTDEKPSGFGHFVTVWKKEAEGTWKVLVDVGTEHPAPQEAVAEIQTFVPEFPIPAPETSLQKLEQAERAFDESLSKDEGAAMLGMASDDIRIYRRGRIPAVGKSAAQILLGPEHGKTTRKRSGGQISSARDLVYRYGEYASERADGNERGIYFCIWRIDPNGDWKLALDLQKKAVQK